MAAFDDRKTNQKQSTVLMQVAADALYQTKRNIVLEVWLSCKPYSHFNNWK